MILKLFVSFCILALSSTGFGFEGPPHLYFFTSTHCEPCKHVAREIEVLQSKNYPVTRVDVDQRPDLARDFQIDRWPTCVLVHNEKVVARKSGIIDARTLAGWFMAASPATQPATANHNAEKRDATASPAGQKTTQSNVVSTPRGSAKRRLREIRFTNKSEQETLHKGTRQPRNDEEFNALRATVRLKVEDPDGFSHATGTVIHSRNGEWLVMTCGHVFRDSRGTGSITADFGFETDKIKTAPGELISYNDGPRDVALVAVRAGFDIQPVSLAPLEFPVQRSDQVFTVGCDHGQDATIRRTRIINQALYDNSKKYEIIGRPVIGRSGGGLFTAGGQLFGVCNAALVEVDEGVYSSLENVYYQLEKSNLAGLFQDEPTAAIAQQSAPRETGNARDRANPIRPSQLAAIGPSSSVDSARPSSSASFERAPKSNPNLPSITQVAHEQAPGQIPASQIVVVFQSRDEPGKTETFVIDEPSNKLYEQIKAESQQPVVSPSVALSRENMPLGPRPKTGFEYRAQSPR